MFSIGDKLVHCPEGVCIVEGICKLNMGKQCREFYKLRSVIENEEVVYIPVDSQNYKVRELKSREEVIDLLEMEPEEHEYLHQNTMKRANIQNQAIYQDNSVKLMKLIKLYMQRKEQSAISIGDSSWLKKAERYLFSEIAEVLECEYSSLLQMDKRIVC